MGYSTHAIDNFGPPFLLVDERVFTIPRLGNVYITVDQFKFIFMLNGDIEHESSGIHERRPLRQGDILVCPSFKRHYYCNPTNQAVQAHVVRLFLDGGLIRQQLKRRDKRPEQDITQFIGHHFMRTVQLEGGIDGEITECLNKLRREADQGGIGMRHRARSLCTELIILTARRMLADSHTNHTRNAKSAHIVANAKEYILKNLKSKLTLGEIAWQIGKGEEHLARVFKRETGQSVFDFVREMRINQAKTHLLGTSEPLSHIAEACGFSSLSFFSRTFKELVGVPPSEYRRYIEATEPVPVGTESQRWPG